MKRQKFLMPTTALVELITEAQHKKRILTYEIAADIATGRPRALLAVASGYEHIQLVYDSLANVLAVYGMQNVNVSLRLMVMSVSDNQAGNMPARISAMAGFLASADKVGKVLSLYFDDWPIQQRRESLVIGATGNRNCDAVKSHLWPILESEQAQATGNVIGVASDLPDDFLPDHERGS